MGAGGEMNVADQIKNMLLSSGFSNVFSTIPSALDCAEPIVVSQGEFSHEARLVEEERGTLHVTVLVVRDVAANAEAMAVSCEKAVRGADWEPFAEAWPWRIVGIDTTAPAFKERDGSGRFVWAFEAACTVVRAL